MNLLCWLASNSSQITFLEFQSFIAESVSTVSMTPRSFLHMRKSPRNWHYIIKKILQHMYKRPSWIRTVKENWGRKSRDTYYFIIFSDFVNAHIHHVGLLWAEQVHNVRPVHAPRQRGGHRHGRHRGHQHRQAQPVQPTESKKARVCVWVQHYQGQPRSADPRTLRNSDADLYHVYGFGSSI